LSKVPIKNILKNFSENLVTICDIDTINKKSILLKKSHEYAIKNNYDWLIYLDADEFIVLKEHHTIHAFLEKYTDYEQVLLNWYMFGSNNRDTFNGGTIIENYTKSAIDLHNQYKTFVCITNIIKNNNKIKYYNVHVRGLKDMSKSITTRFIKITSNNVFNKEYKENINDVPAYIAHYVLQAYNIYLQRKVSKPMDHNGEYRSTIPIDKFHKIHNKIENKEVLDKYNEKNKIMIEKYINREL
jgi:hypothetical protein